MGSFSDASWGPHRAWFTLPRTRIQLTGLDAAQLSALQGAYPGFVQAAEGVWDGGEEFECRACRLTEPVGLSDDVLTRDGQYSPEAIHRTDGIDLTGINFRARVPVARSVAPGWLGVAQLQELAQPNVIENFLRVFSAHHALSLNGVVLHSAGLVLDGRAYLFAGRSGAGKTTLTRKGHAAGADVLSDDVNLVLPGTEGYEAHAVPFTGEFGRTLVQTGARGAYPVAGVVLLERGKCLGVEPIRPSAAVARLLVASPFVNSEEAVAEPLLTVLTALVARVSVIALRCRREDDFDEIMAAVKEGFADERAA